MPGDRTHYHVLGLRPDVTAAEIKRAYRRLVKSWHPDPGHSEKTVEDRSQATERMMRLNQAYETLMDKSKRKAYDSEIGIYRGLKFNAKLTPIDENAAREKYLRQVFNPARHSISRVLKMYPKELQELSLDIYDEVLIAKFEEYVNEVESALRLGADAFASQQWPRSLDAAVHMMRYCIAQAADGLEELRRFTQNFNYDHLMMAGNLFRIALDLSRQSLRLSKT